MVEQQRRIPDAIVGQVGHYLLLSKLGAGGMGVVFRALQPISGQVFAIKVLNDQAGIGGRAGQLLRQEADTQAAIVHPNIVRLFDFVNVPGRLAIVMELVEGVSLREKITERAGRALSAGQLAWLGAEMALGLEVVHQHGFIHADIKPANFLFGVSQQGHAVLKVADFGIARSLADQKQIIAGTYGYMSPEQIRGEPISRASDLYGLGCVLFELACGSPVFGAVDGADCAERHCHERAPAIPMHRAPRHVRDLIAALLEKEPGRRPATAEAVMHTLRSAA